MLVTPRGTAAAALYDFKDRVDPDEVVRKYRRAALLGISRQPIGINASSAIDGIPILINRRIENHCRSDFGAVGGGGDRLSVRDTNTALKSAANLI